MKIVIGTLFDDTVNLNQFSQNASVEIDGTDPNTGLSYGNLGDSEVNEIADFFRGFYADKIGEPSAVTVSIEVTDNARAVTVDV